MGIGDFGDQMLLWEHSPCAAPSQVATVSSCCWLTRNHAWCCRQALRNPRIPITAALLSSTETFSRGPGRINSLVSFKLLDHGNITELVFSPTTDLHTPVIPGGQLRPQMKFSPKETLSYWTELMPIVPHLSFNENTVVPLEAA